MEKIAVCGKGGSGKTVVVSLLSPALKVRGRRPLVVDSDESNTGLHRMLGFSSPPEPLIDLMGGKDKVEGEILKEVNAGVPENLVGLMKREISVADIPDKYIKKNDVTSLVSVGKILMALQGCACPMGIVSRSFLKALRLEPDEVAVIDMEAGVEHFGRGVETSVDCVLVVVEPSLDSLEVAERIGIMSRQIDIGDVWAVLNKITSEEVAHELEEELRRRALTVIGSIQSDPEIALSCLRGRPLPERFAEETLSRILDFLFP
jgi:CO dehydrogenase maturation factor